ncbi:Tfp pilus assembly major pilin PilA [Rhizobium wenxiniae]|uniref:Tfp pilus assembly major pilin PilA n=1 Tax=Rhizobium wenxiniae TaxID=1737357 RepID=A0A7W9YD26_9HYPH|nr:Tfp pilus assembly major pilin PilA [Rhizobium wenxiniae]
MGDGKFVIVSCIIACAIISVIAVIAILAIHF